MNLRFSRFFSATFFDIFINISLFEHVITVSKTFYLKKIVLKSRNNSILSSEILSCPKKSILVH